VKYSCVQLYV